VTLVVAQGCHLCEAARRELSRLGFALEELDITGVPELEERYRVFIPVVEVDGEQVSVFEVDEHALRHKLGLL
jgi:glutaredoxin